MKIYTGTSGYAYKVWKGIFYPEKISPKEMLHFYAGHFSSVEVNNTFYHMPTADVLDTWAEHVPANFIFAVKAPQVITHFRRLRHVSEEARYLFGTLPVLGSKLGPVIFQFPESFHADLPLLEAFIGLIPRAISAAFEFRHPSWMGDETMDILRAHGCCLCIADSDESPAEGIITTASWGYLRLRRYEYSDDELKEWLERIVSQQWQKAFVYFKHEDEARGPQAALRFQELIASVGKTDKVSAAPGAGKGAHGE